MTTSSLDKTLDLRHYVKVLWRRKGLLILSTVSVVCAALISLSIIPPVYESRAMIYFNESQPLIPELRGNWGSGLGRSAEGERANYVFNRMRSTPFLQNVALLLKMVEDPVVQANARDVHQKQQTQTVDEIAMSMVVESIRSRISFTTAGIGLYEVAVTDSKAESALHLTRAISENFTDEIKRTQSQQIEDVARKASDFIAAAREEFRRAEQELMEYEGVKIGEDQNSVVRNENLPMAEALLAEIQQYIEGAEINGDRYKSAVIAASNSPAKTDAILRDPEVRRLADALEKDLSREIDNILLLGRATSSSPSPTWPPEGPSTLRRQELSRVVEERARKLYPRWAEKSLADLSSYAFFRLDTEVQSALSDSLDRRIQDFKLFAQRRPIDESKVMSLQKKVEQKRAYLDLWETQQVSSELSGALENQSLGRRVEVLNPAEEPLAPIRPNKMKIFLAALLLGPLLGAGFAFLSETLDSTLWTLDEIQRVAPEPILCTTPLLMKLKQRRRGMRRHWVSATVSGVVALTVAFFALRMTVLRNVVVPGQSIRTVTPSIDTGLRSP